MAGDKDEILCEDDEHDDDNSEIFSESVKFVAP
jgi:hypothetical protein